MKLLKLFSHWRRRSVSFNEVVAQISHPDYGTTASAERIRADYDACCALTDFVKENFSEDAHQKYLLMLTNLRELAESKATLEKNIAAENQARVNLDRAYETQLDAAQKWN
jgi:hypothetical protein